jgi:putative phosphoesterase
VRIAVVSDIHGNVTAFEAVLADLRYTAPDLILHGGDLTVSGSDSAQIVDRVRDLGWPGVIGNTDEMLVEPHTLDEFAATVPGLEAMWAAIREIAAATRAALGEDRIAWLRQLPRILSHDSLAIVHASPTSAWRAPNTDASDEELRSVYGELGKPVTVYGHIHRPYIRNCAHSIVVNTGSVSLSYDGDARSSYVLMDDGLSSIRRVEYDVEKEVHALSTCKLPHTEWIARSLRNASPQAL